MNDTPQVSVKLSEVIVGDVLIVDGGFTCMKNGVAKVIYADSKGLYIHCTKGRHWLDGQTDAHDNLVGLTRFVSKGT